MSPKQVKELYRDLLNSHTKDNTMVTIYNPPRDTPKSEQEINAEKAAKSRPDLVPGRFALAAGRSFAIGAVKHGTPRGLGSYRVAGTEQATVTSHWASMERHLAEIKAGHFMDDAPGGTGLAHIDCVCAQISIIVDLMENPAGPIPENDLRWYPADEIVANAVVVPDVHVAVGPEAVDEVLRSQLCPTCDAPVGPLPKVEDLRAAGWLVVKGRRGGKTEALRTFLEAQARCVDPFDPHEERERALLHEEHDLAARTRSTSGEGCP